MPKIPKDPQEIFQEFTQDYQKLYGEDLISIILYGSAAKGEYVYKKSDINFLIILSEKGIENLRKSLDLVPKWKKRNVATPLFLTKSYIETSLDSFPIEFLDMKEHHQLIYGEDVLKDIDINLKYLRLQCEREVKSKLLHLRQAYLNTHGKRKHMETLISRSIITFASIFRALLKLKGKEIPARKREVILSTSEEFGLDKETFEKLLKIRENRLKLSPQELSSLIKDYIEQIRELSQRVDQM